jgi:hypothetical protein
MNSPGKEGAAGQVRTALFETFADRYLPGPALEGTVDAKTAAEHAQMIAGNYTNSRRAQTSFVRLVNLAGPTKVSVNEDGTISVPMAKNYGGVPLKWQEVEPFVWREVNGKTLLSAEVLGGRVQRFSFGMVSPFMIFERTPVAVSSTWLLPALLGASIALLLTSLAWPVSALVRRYYGVAYRLSGLDAKAHRWVRIAATGILLALVAWAVTIAKLLMSAPAAWLWVLQLVSLVVFVAGAAVAAWNAYVVVRGSRKWYAKAWAVTLALSALVLLWVAYAFNLLTLGAGY